MIKSFCTGLFALIILTLSAQTEKAHPFSNLEPRNIGPAGMSGRVTAIDVVKNDRSHILIGTASGGVWESDNGGIKWKPIFDDQPTLSIGDLKIDPQNPDVIWVGTGEGNPRNSHNSGAGVFKSMDGGRSWSCMGLKESKLIHRIIIDPNNTNVVYVGALGSAWGESGERGVYKTQDGGKTWRRILHTNRTSGVGDMVLDPSNSNKLLVAMWDFQRTPWSFRSGGEGSGLFLTHDGGENWTKMTTEDGLPKGELGRMGLAFATNKPDVVYALIEAKENGFFRSEDGGRKWQKVASKNIGNRPFYYADIYVDPSNENRIFNLWSYVSLSEDGGRTFKNIMDYSNSIHPDHHAFYIDDNDPDFIINGNDGGLNISYDGGQTWSFSGNIPIGQFYHVNYDTSFPYNIYGGMQDNGSWVGPHRVFRRGGIRNDDWKELYFGDGFDVVPILSDDRYGYAMSQGGNVAIYDRNTGRTRSIKPVHPDSTELRFSWNAAISPDPFNADGLYFGSQFVHYSPNRGDDWRIISPDLTTNDPIKQEQAKSGGLTLDVTQAENHTTILCISPSILDSNEIWVGTDDGKIQLTIDGGENWEDLSTRLPNMPEGAWIPQIELGVKSGEAYIVVNDYRRNNWEAFLYHTTNYGKSFERIITNEDVGGFVLSVLQDPTTSNLLFAGTDVGLYYSLNQGDSWERWPTTLPHVQISDLKVHPVSHDLIIGTFGRSLWVVDDISFLRDQAKYPELLDRPYYVVEPRTAVQTYMASYQGVRFYAQGEFIGKNPPASVATMTYHIPSSDTIDAYTDEVENGSDEGNDKMEAKKKKSKIEVVVFDQSWDTIRNFKVPPKVGWNRFYWRLDRNGIRYPSRKKAKKDEDPVSGGWVLPGRYFITSSYKGIIDTAEIVVHRDPRIEFDLDDAKQRQTKIEEFERLITDLTDAHRNLLDARDDIRGIKGLKHSLTDSMGRKLMKLVKGTSGKIDSLEQLILAPEEQKGIPDRSGYLLSKIYRARSLLNASEGRPGGNAQNAYSKIELQIEDVIQQIESFFSNEWIEFKSEIEALKIPILRDHQKIK